jgi:glycosyltransferase involved in cell wall biosynthesis
VRGRIGVLSVIADLHFGGDENRLLSFARTVDSQRFDHRVVTLARQDPEMDRRRGSMRQQYADAGVDVIELGEPLANAPPLSLRALQVPRTGIRLWRVFRRLRRVIRERRIDAISIHLDPANPVGVLAAMATGARSIVTAYYVRSYTREPARVRVARRVTLSLADAIVTDSEARAREIRDWAYRRPRVAVIPNGIRPPATGRTAAEMRRWLGLPADRRTTVIGQVSSLIEYKGQSVLLHAARQVLDRDPQVAFLLVGFSRGGDAYRRRLERQAADLGIADRVRIASYPGPIGDIWAAIDIHVHASLFDSLPNAIIEGMSLAKPAVVTAVGGIPEMVEHERTGLVVPPGVPEALSQALLRVLSDRQLARRLGEAARQRYLERCRPETMARSLEELFAELVSCSGNQCAQRGIVSAEHAEWEPLAATRKEP